MSESPIPDLKVVEGRRIALLKEATKHAPVETFVFHTDILLEENAADKEFYFPFDFKHNFMAGIQFKLRLLPAANKTFTVRLDCSMEREKAEVAQVRVFLVPQHRQSMVSLWNSPNMILKKTRMPGSQTTLLHSVKGLPYSTNTTYEVVLWIYAYRVGYGSPGSDSLPGAIPRSYEEEPMFSNYFMSETFSDLKVCVGETTFPVHRLVITEQSPVFKAMLQGEMSEAKIGVLKIEDFEAAVVEHFLHYLYKGWFKSFEVELIMDLLRISHKYDVKPMMNQCETNLLRKLTLENVVKIFKLADFLGAEELASSAKLFFKSNRLSIVTGPDVLQVLWEIYSVETMYKLDYISAAD